MIRCPRTCRQASRDRAANITGVNYRGGDCELMGKRMGLLVEGRAKTVHAVTLRRDDYGRKIKRGGSERGGQRAGIALPRCFAVNLDDHPHAQPTSPARPPPRVSVDGTDRSGCVLMSDEPSTSPISATMSNWRREDRIPDFIIARVCRVRVMAIRLTYRTPFRPTRQRHR